MQVDSKNKIEIVLPGNLENGRSSEFNADINSALKKMPECIVFNCAELLRPASRHIHMLWKAFEMCRENGIMADTANVNKSLLRVFEILDLKEYFMNGDNYDCQTAALPVADLYKSDATDSFSLAIVPDIDGINLAMDRFRSYLEATNIPPLFIFDIVTLFYETTTNVRVHSKIGKNEMIGFRCFLIDDSLNLEFKYAGIEFDLTSAEINFDPSRAIHNGQTHGYGLAMIKKISDNISYTRIDDSTNLLKIIKNGVGNE